MLQSAADSLPEPRTPDKLLVGHKHLRHAWCKVKIVIQRQAHPFAFVPLYPCNPSLFALQLIPEEYPAPRGWNSTDKDLTARASLVGAPGTYNHLTDAGALAMFVPQLSGQDSMFCAQALQDAVICEAE